MANKRGLGKGLQALIPNGDTMAVEGTIREIPIKDIKPNTYQPRRIFSEDKLKELAQSIKENGVIQPIVVRKIGADKYQLIAGERRWRACNLLEQEKIPAVIKDLGDRQVTELALIENIQREDLNAIEEAWAYKTLLEEFGLTQEKLAGRIGKSRSAITNALRLLNLECDVQDLLTLGVISMGHARALLSISDAEKQVALARQVADKGLSVRETERLVKNTAEGRTARKTADQKVLPEIISLQEKLEEQLSTKVVIKHGDNKGRILIDYYDNQDLNRILMLIGVSD
ncbi:ParB/RepB/Spo0J family partition protein [Metallumcola ferriviriculae]|uniref:ParB/RepB/Spo0J family partition protein n=1 Tax=Metallumcola ferriviriculae TaxID=3039180 RepID=A0AAU0UL11_9FIRM|nr:ParB/RepB/Spo0J family partition protein [Desulfitibacteraceae bacterium MK1]